MGNRTNRRNFLSTLAGGVVLASLGSCTDSIVSADSLIVNIDKYVNRKYIDEKEKAVLCHVDQRPCKDTKWIQAKVEAGVADSLSKKSIEKLRQKMAKQGKDYVSIVSIVCEQYEVIV